ncbi:hypothetical protein L1856_07270 [Streptomyces sp. Tue 6430]|nr:hypothetical protein [Streptomyces sp. Tue 6430]
MKTVSRRFGISTLTSLRLFTRALCTRIMSWVSAACGADGRPSVLFAGLINGLRPGSWASSPRYVPLMARRFPFLDRVGPFLSGRALRNRAISYGPVVKRRLKGPWRTPGP